MKSIASPNSPRAAKRERHRPPPASTGVQRLLHAQHEQVEHDGQQHAQPAGDDHVGLERRCRRRSRSPSPPAPAKNASAARPTVVVTAIRSPAMISGSASGSSTRHSSWRSRQAHAAAGVARLGGHAVQAGDHVAEDDQQRVGDERDQRGRLAAAGERQQQEEDRDARDRVEDAGDLRDRRDRASAAGGRAAPARTRSRSRSRRAISVSSMCSISGVLVAVEVVGDPARAEAVVARRSESLRSLRSRDLAAGRGSRDDHAARLSAAISWASSSIDSTPTTRPGVDDRPVLGAVRQQVRERVAQDVVELDDRLGGRAQSSRTRSPSSRARTASRAGGRRRRRAAGCRGRRRRCGADLATGSPTRTSGACHRSTSRTRCSASALERAVGADEVLDERVGRVQQQLGRACAYCASMPPSCRIAMRSPILIASSMSWVTKTIVLRELGLQAQELVLQALAVDRVDRAERLVHQHQRRVGRERAGHADALALAAGELRRVAVAHVAAAGRSRSSSSSTRARDAPLVPAEQARDGRDVVADRPVREQADLLDHVADLAPQLGRRRGP